MTSRGDCTNDAWTEKRELPWARTACRSRGPSLRPVTVVLAPAASHRTPKIPGLDWSRNWGDQGQELQICEKLA